MGHSVMKRAAPPVEETILVIRVMGLVRMAVWQVMLGHSVTKRAAPPVEETILVIRVMGLVRMAV